MERYFEGTPPTEEEIARLIVKAVAQGSLMPMVCVSGKTGVGLPELIDALALCALPPDVLTRTAKNAAGEEVEVKADPAGPLVAQVFKTRIDPFVQKLSFIRVFSGTLKKDSIVPVVGVRKPSSSARCSPCRPTRPSRSTRSVPAESWPWPRSRICTPARRWAS